MCLRQLDMIKTVTRLISPLYQQVKLHGHKVISKLTVELTILCMCSKKTWINIGKPKLQTVEAQYKFADGNPLQVLRKLEVTVELEGKAGGIDLKVVITNMPQWNLFGRQAMVELELIMTSPGTSCGTWRDPRSSLWDS